MLKHEIWCIVNVELIYFSHQRQSLHRRLLLIAVWRYFWKKRSTLWNWCRKFCFVRPLCLRVQWSCLCACANGRWSYRFLHSSSSLHWTLFLAKSKRYEAVRKLHADVIHCATPHKMHQPQYILIMLGVHWTESVDGTAGQSNQLHWAQCAQARCYI